MVREPFAEDHHTDDEPDPERVLDARWREVYDAVAPEGWTLARVTTVGADGTPRVLPLFRRTDPR
ncbi:hypothetical protein [Actinocatenispora rupis]|uniref:Pyridoxamine 5'-phosphate oxidase n=1 Tax=Actinocatenispora rupis TaxID=519421 RepID=A0A8J3JDS4_9ACTN|nr:hypothetical protein [Actinocatenispora rupis]GID14622.1 hypothetical protein Aru02nite_55110 [Actinocatenispora rupis]